MADPGATGDVEEPQDFKLTLADLVYTPKAILCIHWGQHTLPNTSLIDSHTCAAEVCIPHKEPGVKGKSQAAAGDA